MNNLATAIIVAAGQATRYGAPKVLTDIGGIPAIAHVLRAFSTSASIDRIVVVVNSETRDAIRQIVESQFADGRIAVVSGGTRRQDSVAAGLALSGNSEIVVIHDGARPLVSPELIAATIQGILDGADAAIAAVPVADTLKQERDGLVATIDRTGVWRAQTPQAFRTDSLRTAMELADRDGITVTDESMLIERYGGRIVLVAGDERNLKLTVPGDAAIIEALASSTERGRQVLLRAGIGYDVHRLIAGRKLIIGGIEIPYHLGLDGHSDADVLLHAICDAILGACGMGDIGVRFPPSDEQFRGAPSVALLQQVHSLATQAEVGIINVDATVIAEAPRISPYSAAMQAVIAGALVIPAPRVSIKATTNEGMGFAGRGEGIAAIAIANVLMPDS